MSETEEDGEEKESIPRGKGEKTLYAILIIIVLILVILGYLYYKTVFPKQIMNAGKKYYEIKQYDKAMRIFKYMEKKYAKEEEAIYYEVLTLAKMPPIYENQKRLYEIWEKDECDKASKTAWEVMQNIRKQIIMQAGVNYIDNIFNEEVIVRWNNSRAITYAVRTEGEISSDILSITEKAFKQWQRAINNEITFKQNMLSANIVIHITDKIPQDSLYTKKEVSGVTVGTISENKLQRMDIYINIMDKKGEIYSNEKIYSILMHEIGHALGIGSHSASEYDLMNYNGDTISQNKKNEEISLRDINTLMFLYKMVPDAINEPISEETKSRLLYHPIITTIPGANYEIEIKRLIEEIKVDEENIIKWIDLANNLGIRKQYIRANYILKNLIEYVGESKQKQYSIYYNMALNYYKMKEYEEAEKYIKKAENINKNKKTETLSAYIEIKKGKLESAKEKLIILRRENPANITNGVKLAEIYYKEKKYKDSRVVIKDLIKNNPDAKRDARVKKYKK